jgi:hypothetical protein
MKKYWLTFLLAVPSLIVFSQGLENILVEKYYISDANDAKAIGGHLPVGSVTYRIYVDMLPGYKFQAVFGIPGHELRLATTTSFFNNEDFGAIVSTVIPDRNLKDNTVMLDSWLSVGGASEGNFGILKEDDDTFATVVNEKGFLQNENPLAGIPLKKRDGLRAGIPPRVTQIGLDSLMKMFGNHNDGGKNTVFATYNGSWACLNGSIGPTSDNRVLIAQLTTDGIFSFELNIQLGKPEGGVEQYVARNPVGREIQMNSLIYSSINKKADLKMQGNPAGKK